MRLALILRDKSWSGEKIGAKYAISRETAVSLDPTANKQSNKAIPNPLESAPFLQLKPADYPSENQTALGEQTLYTHNIKLLSCGWLNWWIGGKDDGGLIALKAQSESTLQALDGSLSLSLLKLHETTVMILFSQSGDSRLHRPSQVHIKEHKHNIVLLKYHESS